MPDKTNLEMHRGRWRVTVAVPEALKEACEKTRIKVPLDTDSLTEANLKKPMIVQAIKDEFARMKTEVRAGQTPRFECLSLERLKDQHSRISISDALKIREQLCAVPEGSEFHDAVEHDLSETLEVIQGAPIGETRHGNPVYYAQREAEAHRFNRVARGHETPLREAEKAFRAQHNMAPKTWGKFAKIMRDLEGYLDDQGSDLSVEAVTRRVSGHFINAMIQEHGWKSNTINAYLSTLRSYWKFMVARGYATENPWQGQSLPKERRSKGDSERAFTDDEMRLLLRGKPHQPYLADLIRIAALTGARLEALVTLKVGDCADGVFMMPPQKEEPDARLVPIHPSLEEIVARRTQGRSDSCWLFPEVEELPEGGSLENRRSNSAGKAFIYYRKKLGVDDRREGARRSLVNFHSFRRWFITKAKEALEDGASGYRDTTVEEVVGHKLKGMTEGVYKGSARLQTRRACVEAVRLPVLD